MNTKTREALEAYKQIVLRELTRCEARTLDRHVFLWLQRIRSRLEMGVGSIPSLPVLKEMDATLSELKARIDRGEEQQTEPLLRRLEELADAAYREPLVEAKDGVEKPGILKKLRAFMKRTGDSPRGAESRAPAAFPAEDSGRKFPQQETYVQCEDTRARGTRDK